MNFFVRENRLKTIREKTDIEIYQKNKLQRAYRRMPWYMAPKKDVTSCEKLRGVANELRSVDIRMWEHSIGNTMLSYSEYIAV